MIIIGIDPGIERLGWSVIEKNVKAIKRLDSGVKKTLSSKKEEGRLLEISEFIDELCQKYKPEHLCVERIFFSSNAKTAITIGGVRGVVMLSAAKHKIPVKEFAPLEVKMAICGYGKADKSAVWRMVKMSIDLPQKKFLDDESDALAIALSGAYSIR